MRDAQSRANYNRGIIDKAIAEEAEEKRANAHSRHAAAQKRKVEEVATACAAKRAKTCQHQKGASGKTSTSSTSVPATSKPGSSSSAPASASAQHFEFCKLLEHKGFATCKSTMQKQLQRKFEHKGYAGAAHALAVAKEFQIATEKLVTETLGQTKLEGLKKFCSDNEIEIPAVTRLTKAFLYEFIEEASQRGILSVLFMLLERVVYSSQLFYLLYWLIFSGFEASAYPLWVYHIYIYTHVYLICEKTMNIFTLFGVCCLSCKLHWPRK